MGFLQHGKPVHPRVLHSLCLRTIYNFTYRLSGNTRIAEIITEKVLLKHANNHDDVFLLKQAWEYFLEYYGCLEFKGEEPIQQALLALQPELRCSVILRNIFDYSYPQISAILNITEIETSQLISEGIQEIGRQINASNATIIT